MKRTIDFKTCWLHLDGSYCETVFPDGTRCSGTTGLDQPGQAESARAMGYPLTEAGLAQMLGEHDAAHTFISQKCGEPYSRVLWNLAHFREDELTPEQRRENEREERLAGAFQTYANTGALSPDLERVGTPEQLSEWKTEFLLMMRGAQ